MFRFTHQRRLAIGLPSPKPVTAVLTLVAFSVPYIFWGLGRYGVVGADEAFYQDVALTMAETGDWLTVQSGAHVYIWDTLTNAPLQYWIRGFLVKVLGPSMLSMRLFSAVSALLAVLATYRMVQHFAGRRAAWIAGLVLITTFQFLYLHSARTGELEPAVCLLLVALATSFLRAIEDPKRGLVTHHILLGLLLTLKAPTLPIPIVAELSCFALIPAARARFAQWCRLGFLIVPPFLSWHLYQAWTYREMLEPFVRILAFQAGSGFDARQVAGVIGHLAYYLPILIFGTFPWVLFLPVAAVAQLRSAVSAPPEGEPWRRGFVIHTATVFGFYLAISKYGPWYLVHGYPFLAALLGIWWADLAEGSARAEIAGAGLARGFVPSAVLVATLAGAAALGLFVALEMRDFNPFAIDAYAIPMETGWRRFAAIGPTLGVPATGALVFALFWWMRGRLGGDFARVLALVLFVGAFAVAGLRALLPLAYVDHQSPVAALHAELQERQREGQHVEIPVEVPLTHRWIVNYYFYRDFDIAVLGARQNALPRSYSRFRLYPRGTREASGGRSSYPHSR